MITGEDLLLAAVLAVTIGGVAVLGVRARQESRRRPEAAEARREEARAQELSREAEQHRRQTLQNLDPIVDRTVNELCRARADLSQIIDTMPPWPDEPEHVAVLKSWVDTHGDVMDFPLFAHLMDEYVDETGPFVEAGLIRSTLDEHFDAASAIRFADDRLGIERRWRLVDGPQVGGWECEAPDGRWIPAEERLTAACVGALRANEGFVYVLTNPSLPGLVKVGSTVRNPSLRAAELSSPTGIPTPYVVAFSLVVRDPVAVERATHNTLSRYRVSRVREHFKVGLPEAVDAIRRASAGVRN